MAYFLHSTLSVHYLRFLLGLSLMMLVPGMVSAQPFESNLRVFNHTYSYTTAGGASVSRTIPVKIYVPSGTFTEPLPVVMYLHGSGERGNGVDIDANPGVDTWAFSDSLKLIDRPAIYVAPRGIKDFLTTDPEYIENLARWGSEGYAGLGEYWLNNYGTSDEYDYRNFPVSASLRGALSLTDTLLASPSLMDIDNNPITLPLLDSNRQYLVGWSAGGDGVWDAVTRNPKKYAAAIPVSGVGDPGAIFGSHVVSELLAQPLRAFVGENDLPDQKSALLKMQSALSSSGALGTGQVLTGENHFSVSNAVFGNVDNRNWLYGQTLATIPEPISLVLCFLGLVLLPRRRTA